jgi:photosynthetic reaction center cytochrome c subunit
MIVRQLNLTGRWQTGAALVALLGTLFLSGCERPPVDAKQQGYRGTGMESVTNPRIIEANASLHKAPDSLPAAPSDGPKAKDVYKNVKVLGDLSVAEFTRHMAQVTSWVSPKEGCAYCHNVQNFADDSKYQKVVARRMIQMTQHINADWNTHVGKTGVTCYTCHRGQPHPEYSFYSQPAKGKLFLSGDNGQNKPSPSVGFSSLPYDPMTKYLVSTPTAIRVQGTAALPYGNKAHIQDAEGTYALMMHFSKSLGANCTTCHNAQNFQGWDNNPPQKVTAWHGIQMVRDVNKDYILPLESTFPADHRGPAGDAAKVACATCHQGVQKPLNGTSMIGAHPELAKITAGLAPYAAGYTPVAVALTAPPAVASTDPMVLGRVLFEVNKTSYGNEGKAEVAAAVEAMKKSPELKVDISGFADSRGDPVKNGELAKQRAFAVRDALTAGGIAADRVNLRKPGAPVAGGSELDARRVEIISAK